MEHDFLDRFIGKFPGATENLICVFRTGYSKRNSRLPVLTFALHLPRPWTDRFAHVNGKQPLFCGVLRRYVSQNTVAITGTLPLNRFTLLYVFQ